MTPEQAACEKEWLEWVIEEFTASALITAKPCFVSFISVSPADPALAYYCRLYDGESTSGTRKFYIKGQYVPRHINSHPPMSFKHGIYFEAVGNVDTITIQYKLRGKIKS